MEEKTPKKKRTFDGYTQIEYDEDGWAEMAKHEPFHYDLVIALTATGKKKIGWWNGQDWTGHYIKETDNIVKWKRRKVGGGIYELSD